jgi:hypothetical protein
MNKEERRKQIEWEKKTITAEREKLRGRLNSLAIELDYIRGHYDKSWEEVYAK